MALPKVYRVAQDAAGNVVPGVLCSVMNQGTGVLATLWQNDAGTIPLSNPMTSDATYGSFGFYVLPGHYDLTFTKPGYVFQSQVDFQVPADMVTLGTMATQNANAVVITGGTLTGVTVPNTAGSGITGIYSQLQAAGGTDRYFIATAGNAPSLLRGSVQIGDQPALWVDATYGRVGIGKFAPIDSAALRIHHPRATTSALWLQPTDSDVGGNNTVQLANVAGTAVGSITCTATTTAYNTTSDGRLKEAVEDLPEPLALVQALRPVAFRWRGDGSPGQGFLASDVQQVVPGVITGEPDAVDEEGHILPQQIDYSKLVPWLCGAVKELAQQVQALTARLEASGG